MSNASIATGAKYKHHLAVILGYININGCAARTCF